jgi:hypothetical protein
MEFEFWWDDGFFGALRPRCTCDGAAAGGAALLAGLLTDDGGITPEWSIAWLDVGLERVRAVRLGQVERCDWARETLIAAIAPEGVRIVWLLHEDEAGVVGLKDFEQVLGAWRDFLAAGPARERVCIAL